MNALNLDHIGIAVHHLDAAEREFARLGFTLTPRGYHTLPPPSPEAERPRAGTSNNCAMLERGYIELIGVTDPGYSGRLRSALAHYEGLHIVAFGTSDTAATIDALKQAGVPSHLRPLERPIDLGAESGDDGRSGLARFDIVDYGDDILPELYSFAIRHMTPELLWQPQLLAHANGAKSLEAITVAVADREEFAARLGRVVGARAAGDDALTIQLEPGEVRIVDEDWVARHSPGVRSPLPFVAGMTLGTADLGVAASLLSKNGVEMDTRGGSIIVPAAAACGAFIEFVAA